MLIGNVGKDPDVRYYEADQAVAQVSLATTEQGYTLTNGTYRFYDDQRGQRRFVAEILVENMEMLTPKLNTNKSDASQEAF